MLPEPCCQKKRGGKTDERQGHLPEPPEPVIPRCWNYVLTGQWIKPEIGWIEDWSESEKMETQEEIETYFVALPDNEALCFPSHFRVSVAHIERNIMVVGYLEQFMFELTATRGVAQSQAIGINDTRFSDFSFGG